MDNKLWVDHMNKICTSARVFNSLNVIDLPFKGGHSREVYVAATAEQRQQGLSGVSLLDLDGMLFCYDTPTYVPFTAQNMVMNFSIAWFDQNGLLLRSRSVSPGWPSPLLCDRAFSYVLEAPMGTIPTTDLMLSWR